MRHRAALVEWARRVASLACVSAGCLLTSAEAGGAQRLAVGAVVGVNSSAFAGDVETLIGAQGRQRLASSAGALVSVDAAAGRLRLQLGGQFQQKGTVTVFAGSALEMWATYVELLAPTALLFPLTSSVTARVFAGPSLAIEVACKVERASGTASVEQGCDAPSFEVPTRSVDIGVLLGGGVDIDTGPGAITFEVFRNLGLRNISGSSGPGAVRTRNTQVLIGYRLTLSP